MKQLPKLLIFSLLLTIVGCSREYDDSALVGRVNNLESRVLKLEQLCQQMNTNISSLQTIVSALQNNDYVTGVVPVTEGGKTVGYTISFTKSQPVTIYHGKDGVDGKNGIDGKDGQNGADGKDGKSYVPVIGVRQDTDGVYYWTLDGKWLIDGSGNKVKAEGRDGKNGADGKDGLNGSDGKDGTDGKNGQDGADGKDGANGADGRDGITPVLKIEDNYWFISYDNGGSWTKLGKATGENGRDGVDGKDGKDGENGRDGVDGKDGKDGENGRDGVDGKDGKDGENGHDGVDGKDGINPLLQIIDGYWYASYDNGSTWQELGKATGADGKDGHDGINGADGRDGDSFFQDVTQDDSKVHFILADGTVITLPKAVALDIVFNETDLVLMPPCNTRRIAFWVTSPIEPVVVEVTSSADIKAKVILDNNKGMSGKIEVTTSDRMDEYSKVIVFVSNGEKVIMRSITFEEMGLKVEENTVKEVSDIGGEITLEFLSNMDFNVHIPYDAQSWISVVPTTRTLAKQTINLKIEPNRGDRRNSVVTVRSDEGGAWGWIIEYQIKQNGQVDPTIVPDNEIWYRTIDNQPYDIYHSVNENSQQPFDASIISHKYENGLGIISCDRPITRINESAFGDGWARIHKLSELYLPDSIESIDTYGVRGNEYLTTLRIPANLKTVKVGGLNNPNLTSFSGSHVSEDGKCVVIDGVLYAFAPKDIIEYVIPKDVKIIAPYVFTNNDVLERIIFSEGLEVIENTAFSDCHSLKEISFPVSLRLLGSYSFMKCTVEGFYGNAKFHTPDNKCLLSYYPPYDIGQLCCFAGIDVVDYIIPDGIEYIENYAFSSGKELRTITIPESVKSFYPMAFEGCTKLETIYGPNVSLDNRCFVFDNCLKAFVVRHNVPTSYVIPDDITAIGYCAFMDCSNIEDITMGDRVTTIDGYAFSGCPDLKSITLSAGLKYMGGYNAFLSSTKLESIYLRALIPPTYTDTQMSDFPNLKIYVPEQSLSLYQNNAGWSPFKKYFVGYKYDDLPGDSDFYISSDFSNDGKVTTLQSSTEGKGINIVLMGDAYSDRQIADGTYGADMKYIYDNLFTEEPYKSFKEYFNVYSVNVVSATEGYEHDGATLGGYFGDGTLVGGNDSKCFEYAAKAVGEQNMDETLVVVAMNSNNYAGTCYMYNPSSTTGTYGSGASVAYFPKGGDKETFARLLHHEACGHGFAKLADEYAYESMGAVPSDYASQIQTQQSNWGWWKNVDFTGDVSSVRWNAFTNDSRYANEGLGAFEGGLTYWTGVWRPTKNSIMRDNTGGFNAPSREAIYCRIHKLAYGDSWNYSYEDFVTYDEINRKASSSSAPRRSSGRQTRWEPLHPPVVVGKSWKEAAKTQ